MFLAWLHAEPSRPAHLVIRHYRDAGLCEDADSWPVDAPAGVDGQPVFDAADASLREHGWRRLSHWHPIEHDHAAFVTRPGDALVKAEPSFDPDVSGQLSTPGYLYEHFAAFLAALIATGTLPPGARLPGERDLADDHGVSIGTVRRATALLRDQGLVVTLPAKGTYVTANPGSASTTMDRAVTAARALPPSSATDTEGHRET